MSKNCRIGDDQQLEGSSKEATAVMMHPLPQLAAEPASILVVEDQAEVQQAISMLLCGLGHQVATANSPEEALERLARSAYDLILLDLNYRRDTTSGAEGLQLLSLLRSRGIDAPVIAMTAWGSIDVAVKAMHSGACDFLQKPWDNAHLVSLVNQHVREQRAHRQSQLRQEREWQDAVAVQRGLMPREMPVLEGLSMAAMTRPLGYIGGDYYDVFSMGDKVAVCIGDVVGKGVPAALMMSNLQAAVKVTAAHWVSPADVCQRVNELACMNGASDKFITFFYGVLDRRARRLTYCNCGHNPPLLVRADGTLEHLDAGGTLIGLRSGEHFQEGTVTLRSGDRLLLYTDGLSEAENGEGEPYGDERVASVLAGSTLLDAEQLLDRVVSDVTAFCDSNFRDDLTSMAICAT